MTWGKEKRKKSAKQVRSRKEEGRRRKAEGGSQKAEGGSLPGLALELQEEICAYLTAAKDQRGICMESGRLPPSAFRLLPSLLLLAFKNS